MNIGSRKNYIDYMKALAIFLVVWGHSTLTAPELIQLIYAIHMPLFFFFYGLTYNMERHADKGFMTVNFIFDKVKRLVVPYIVWAVIWLLACGNFEITDIIGILYGSQFALKNIGTVTSLWFLPCMFISVLLFELSAKLVYGRQHSNFILISIAAGMIVIAELLPRIEYGYPWSINVSLVALVFIICGCMTRKFFANVVEESMKKDIMLIGGAAIILLSTYRFNARFLDTTRNVDMASANYGLVALCVVDAIAGILIVCIVSKYIDKVLSGRYLEKPILFIGQNTMCIFLLHKPFVQFVCRLVQIDNAIIRQVVSIGISGCVLILCALLAFCIKKLFPEIIGEKRLNSPKKSLDTAK